MPSSSPAQLLKARALAQTGKASAARKAFKIALGPSPDVGTLMEFALFEVNNGTLGNARKLLLKARHISPSNPDIYINLGEVFRLSNDFKNAVVQLRKACELTGYADADALYLLADSEYNIDNFEEAQKHIAQAIDLSPNDAEFAVSQAMIMLAKNAYPQAVYSYRRALDLSPGMLDAAINLATLLFKIEKWNDAISAFAHANSIDQISGNDFLKWISALIYVERGTDAVALAQDFSQIAPDVAVAQLALGLALRSVGEFDKAIAHFRASLEYDPLNSAVYENLAVLKGLEPEDEVQLRELSASDKPEKTRLRANFALYHLLKKPQPAAAFDALKQANDLCFKHEPFDVAQHFALLEETTDYFSAEFMNLRKGQGDQREGPIFIVGMPRSGTTLVETIIAAHEGVHAGGERNTLHQFANSVHGYPASLAGKDEKWAAEKGKHLFDEIFKGAGSSQFVTDKLPGNYINIGLISWLLPASKLIYCKRDAMDTCFSCYEQHFRAGQRFAYDLASLGKVYRAQENIMQHWLENSPLSIHIIEYEKLVAEPESTAKDLIRFCGLNFDKKSIDPRNTVRSISTASVWQARQPINSGSVGKWMQFEKQLFPLKEVLEAT